MAVQALEWPAHYQGVHRNDEVTHELKAVRFSRPQASEAFGPTKFGFPLINDQDRHPAGAAVQAGRSLGREMDDAVRWQTHSVRGFLAGHVRNKLGLELSSEKGPQGIRLYRIIQG